MDAAYDFMQFMMTESCEECGEPMMDLKEVVSKIPGLKVQFSDTLHASGFPRILKLRKGLINSFLYAAQLMNERGWILKVEDGFRTVEMQKKAAISQKVFDAVLRSVQWEMESPQVSADLVRRRLAALVAMAPKVGTHTSGSAIDISVFDAKTGEEIDRGAPYLEMSHLTPMNSPFVSSEARDNRLLITCLMNKAGFFEYPYEFWHYNAGDCYAAYLSYYKTPAIYSPIHLLPDGSIQPIANPTEYLNPLEEIDRVLQTTLEKSGVG